METKCWKTIKKSVSLILSLLMILSLLSTAPLIAGATAVEETSGELNSCRWSYDEGTKTITISGKGKMELNFEEENLYQGELSDYEPFSPYNEYRYPENYWSQFINEIENVVIEEGITNVGSGAFCNHKALKSVKLSSTVEEIESYAFAGCSDLETIELPDSLSFVNTGAFEYCDNLKEVKIGKSYNNLYFSNDAFDYDTSLTEFTVSEENPNLCAIDGNLYTKNMKTLLFYAPGKTDKSFTVPDGVEVIGNGFYMNDSLETVVFSDSVRSVPSNCFIGCDNLKSLSLGAGITEIPKSLNSKKMLEEINVSDNSPKYCSVDGVLYTKDMKTLLCFPVNKQVTGYVVPDGVTTIDSGFCYCDKLENITLPKSLTSIGSYAFSGCESLKAIDLPEGLDHIGYKAFDCCELIKSVDFPNSLTSIGSYAFYNCKGISTINLPGSLTYIGQKAFEGTAYYDNPENWDEGVLYNGKCLLAANKDIVLENGEYVIKDGTELIAEYAIPTDIIMSGMPSISGVTVPSSVKYIGDRALGYYDGDPCYGICVDDSFVLYAVKGSAAEKYAEENNISLFDISDNNEDILFSGSDNDIDWSLDANSATLTISGSGDMRDFEPEFNSASNPESGEEFYGGEYSGPTFSGLWFPYIDKIENIIIESGVTSIGNYAFYGAKNLKTITIADTVKRIGDAAFVGCSELERIDASSVTEFGCDVFSACVCLKEIKLSKDLKRLSDCMFSSCSSLREIDIPESVESIGRNVFSGCNNLNVIYIPANVTSIDNHAFYNASNIKYYMADSENKRYSAFEGNLYDDQNSELIAYATGRSVERFTPREGTKSIAAGAFYNCDSLKYVTLPDGLETIKDSAFSGCTNLEETTIPNTVTDIASTAFIRTKIYTDTERENGVLYFGNHLIDYKDDGSGEKELTVKNGTVCIARSAFRDAKLDKINLPESVRAIGNLAFYSSDIKSAEIPDSVEILGEGAFNGCENLENIKIGSGLQSIPASAFESAGLEKVVIPENINSIGTKAFFNCKNLKTAEVPDSVSSIGDLSLGYQKVNDDYNDPAISKTDLTIYGAKDSAAQAYANECELKFVAQDEILVDPTEPAETETSDATETTESLTTETVETTNATSAETTEPVETATSAETTEPVETATSAETTEPVATTVEPVTTTATVNPTESTTNAVETTTVKQSAPKTVKSAVRAKLKNPMKVKAKTKAVKAKKLVNKAQKLKAISVKKAVGKVRFKKLGGSKFLKISKNGTITVKKGIYKKNKVLRIKVKVTAKGSEEYYPAKKTVIVKIKIK